MARYEMNFGGGGTPIDIGTPDKIDHFENVSANAWTTITTSKRAKKIIVSMCFSETLSIELRVYDVENQTAQEAGYWKNNYSKNDISFGDFIRNVSDSSFETKFSGVNGSMVVFTYY